MIACLKELAARHWCQASFLFIWHLYEVGALAYNEELFLNAFVTEGRFYLHPELLKPLIANEEFAEKILENLYKYGAEININAKHLKAQFKEAVANGFAFDRQLLPHLFESLLNPWKRDSLGFFAWWIQLMQPTRAELLASQQTLFALLTLGNARLTNFAMPYIAEIADEADFDRKGFVSNFPLRFTLEKVAKAQLLGVKLLKPQTSDLKPHLTAEELMVLLIQPDEKLQVAVAELLVEGYGDEGLSEIVQPYELYLKPKAKAVFSEKSTVKSEKRTAHPNGISNEQNSFSNKEQSVGNGAQPLWGKEVAAPQTSDPTPQTWNNLLFFIDDCICEQSVELLEGFFASLLALQEAVPADYAAQLTPYFKQLDKFWMERHLMSIFRKFVHSWAEGRSFQWDSALSYEYEPYWKMQVDHHNKRVSQAEYDTYMWNYELYYSAQYQPHFFYIAQLTLQKYRNGNKLPLLSTPTHKPFYIEAEAFLDRLLQYESAGATPDLHDLIVACNRLLFKEVSDEVKAKAQQLRGGYALALQYYLGLSEAVTPTEDYLPLWAAVCRNKEPQRVFTEFEGTSAAEILTVVKPFSLGFEVKMRKQSTVTFHYLSLEDNWNNNYIDDKQRPTGYPVLYYAVSLNEVGYDADVAYQLSFCPHCGEGQLARYIASYAKGNEVDWLTRMQQPLEIVVRERLPIYHGGWLYMAAALLFEKRPTRDLAADYITMAVQAGADTSYLAECIGRLLADQYAPIARFIEFLDRPLEADVRVFGQQAVAAYLKAVEGKEKKPANHKKLLAFSF